MSSGWPASTWTSCKVSTSPSSARDCKSGQCKKPGKRPGKKPSKGTEKRSAQGRHADLLPTIRDREPRPLAADPKALGIRDPRLAVQPRIAIVMARYARSSPRHLPRPLPCRISGGLVLGQVPVPAETCGNAPGCTRRPPTSLLRCSPAPRRPEPEPEHADPAEAKKQERLQKIRQLTFDRRPAAILKAWSTPRDEALKAPEPNAATIQNIQTPAAVRRPPRRKHAERSRASSMPARSYCRGCRRDRPAKRAERQARWLRPRVAGVPVRRHPGRLAGSQGAFWPSFPQERGKAAYEQLIQSLGSPPGMQGNACRCKCSSNANADADEHGHALWHEHQRAAQRRSSS